MSGPLCRLYSIFDVIESHKVDLAQEIKQMSGIALQGDVHALAEQLASRYSFSVPVLHENRQYATQQEIQIDVSGDPTSQFMEGNFSDGPTYMSATEVTVSIPFDGDPGLFNVKPATFSMSPPRGYVSDHELKLVFTVRRGGANLKQQYEEAMRSVRNHLGWLSESASQLPSKLEEEAVRVIMQRKLDVDARAAAVDSLGIPVRRQSDEAGAAAPRPSAVTFARQVEVAHKAEQKWDVFVSHASEDKDEIARPLARDLEAAGLAVWFDEKSLQLGDSLRAKIDQGLLHSTFGVVILSRPFFEKHSPQQELNGMAAREVNGTKVILPVWHKISANEVRSYSAILADRLAISTDRGIDAVVKQIVDVVKPRRT